MQLCHTGLQCYTIKRMNKRINYQLIFINKQNNKNNRAREYKDSYHAIMKWTNVSASRM